MKRSTIESDREEFLSTSVTALYRGNVKRAFEGKCSPRAASKAKCLDCCCYVREDVETCQVYLCPLHAFRPYQKKGAGIGAPRRADEARNETGPAGSGVA